MRRWQKIFAWIALICGLLVCALWLWLWTSRPQYQGELVLQGLEKPVETTFDEVGIPHIHAENRHDLYLAFGYIHAQDRLFQMELLRRAGGGRLAEILGKDLVPTDILFRTLGLTEYAAVSAEQLSQSNQQDLMLEMDAYLEGINQFVSTGKTPPEFSLLGIPKEKFTRQDMYLITGAMAFSFSQAQKTDFILDDILLRYGDNYLADLAVYHDPNESCIPSFDGTNGPSEVHEPGGILPHSTGGSSSEGATSMVDFANGFNEMEARLPFAPLLGSNAWVVGGNKTRSGKVIFCNDTHIGYLIPQTWYEAYLECPGFAIYGHFMAGIPFALIGTTPQLSWGLTMLLNDDMDFFRETMDAAHPDQYLFRDEWLPVKMHSSIISVKGEPDTTIEVRSTHHGPLINSVFAGMDKLPPVSMFWTYTALSNRSMEALHGMNHAVDFASFEGNLPLIHAPGLNINYGDNQGNFAWWACARLLKRPRHVNSLTLLDGNSGKDEYLGYYDFNENPRAINPDWGFIYSANDWPSPMDSIWYPGYYKPQVRGDRIKKLLRSQDAWDYETMKVMMTDATNETDARMLDELIGVMMQSNPDESRERLLKLVKGWNGEYSPESIASTLFNRWLYHLMKLACEDEMGEKSFDLFLSGHQFQRAYPYLFRRTDAAWWDNVSTDRRETRDDCVATSFEKATEELTAHLGDDYTQWQWGAVTSLELKHPFGKVALFRPFFDVGPFPVSGGNETILQAGFKPGPGCKNEVYYGSQMRIIYDYGNPLGGLNITPCGESGHLMSPHYADQARRYRTRQFRSMYLGSPEKEASSRLILRPL